VPVLPPEEGEEEIEEAVEEVEKSPAERTIKCKICGEEVVFKHYMRHMKEKHPEAYNEWRRKMSESRKEAWARAKAERVAEKPVAEERFKEEEMPPEQLVSLFGREGLDKLKRSQLEKSLRAAPGVSSSQVEWVLYRWNMYDRCREEPQELFRVLHEEAGIKEKIANAIVQSVFSLESQYGHILARRGEPVYIRGPRYEGGPPEYVYERRGMPQPPGFEYPQRPHFPGPPATTEYYPPPYARERPWYEYPLWYRPSSVEYPKREEKLTREDVRNMLEEFYEKMVKEREEKREKERIYNILEGLKDYVEETRHEFDKKILEIKTKGTEEEHPEVRELKARLERYEEEIKRLEKTLEERERKALESQIRSLQSELKAARQEIAALTSRPSEGYSQDTYRLISDAIHQLSTRKPVETIGRLLFPERYYPQTQPTSSRLPPEVEEELDRYGLIER